MALYTSAEQLLVDEVAACPLVQAVHAYKVRLWVGNLAVGTAGLVPLEVWQATYLNSTEPSA
jgi:hypothetical protein